MDFQDLDPETRALIIELQLNGLQSLASTTEASSDLGVTLEAIREELTLAVQTVVDEQLATEIGENNPDHDNGVEVPNAEVINNLLVLSSTPLIYGTSQTEEDNTDSDPSRKPQLAYVAPTHTPPPT